MNLTAEQWERIERRLPGEQRDRRYTAQDNRAFVPAVRWIARSAHFARPPEEFGLRNSVYNRFVRGEKRGLWQRIFTE